MKHINVCHDDHQGSFPIAIIVSKFNHEITDELKQGAVKRLTACGFTAQDITVVTVPLTFPWLLSC